MHQMYSSPKYLLSGLWVKTMWRFCLAFVALVSFGIQTVPGFRYPSLLLLFPDSEENEIGVKLNVRFPFSIINEQKGRIRAGIRLRLKEKMRDNIFYTHKDLIGTIKSLADIPSIVISNKNFQPSEIYTLGVFPSQNYLGMLDLHNTSVFERKLSPADYLPLNYNAKERIYGRVLNEILDTAD